MTNTQEFEIQLVKNRITKKALAEMLGLSETSLYNKIRNLTEFKASEIFAITQTFHLTAEQRDALFFAC